MSESIIYAATRSNNFFSLGTIMKIVSITYILVARPYKKQYSLNKHLDAVLLLFFSGCLIHSLTMSCFTIYLGLYWLLYSFSFHLLTSLHLCVTLFSNPNCGTVVKMIKCSLCLNQQMQIKTFSYCLIIVCLSLYYNCLIV